MQQIYDENHTNSPNISSKRASPERVRSERGGLTLLSFIGFVAAPGDGAVVRFFSRVSQERADEQSPSRRRGWGCHRGTRDATRGKAGDTGGTAMLALS